MVTLFASRKHYLVELEDKNEIDDEKNMNQNDEENVFNGQQNKAFVCTDKAKCHRRPGNENCCCQGPDCEIETSFDGKDIFAKGKNAVCNSKGTPGMTNFAFISLTLSIFSIID